MIITKSLYLAYKQCPKQFWLQQNKPELGTLHDTRRLQIGRAVDNLAQETFPDGQKVPLANNHLRMVSATKDAIKNGVNTLFQATFSHQDLLCRVDILDQLPNGRGWHLIEVKSSSSYKKDKQHLEDVAFQLYVLQHAGVAVGQVSLMHLNKECTAPNLHDLFAIQDVTDDATAMLATVASDVQIMRPILAKDNEPDIFIGTHCRKPYLCSFDSYCWPETEKVTVYDIPRLGKREEQLRQDHVVDLDDIPVNMSFTDNQNAFISRHIEEKIEIDHEAIGRELSDLDFPLHFLDFETINHAIPVYDGCTPYQQVPFQYSCHILHEDGRLEHIEYLHPDTGDPRVPLVEHMLTHIQPAGHIAVYSSFESVVLKKLASDFPQHSAQIESIQDRLWDMLTIFRNHYKDYRFGKSNSIKKVLPVLVPDLTYNDLVVQNGTAAQDAWEQYILNSDEHTRYQQQKDLLAYCKLDTLAMFKIYQCLERVV